MSTLQETCVSLASVCPEISGLAPIFEFMEVAEAEIAGAPAEAWDAFRWCLPETQLLVPSLDRRLWHHHCRQQIQRYLDTPQRPFTSFRAALALATDAELVAAFAAVTPHVKLHHEANVAYMILFDRIFPGEDFTTDVLAPNEPTSSTLEFIDGLRVAHRSRSREAHEHQLRKEAPCAEEEQQLALPVG